MPVYFISAHSPTREITQNSFSQINLDDTKSRTYFCQSKWLTLNAILDRPNLQQKNWRKTNGESLPKNKKSILSCGKLKARGQNLRAEFKNGSPVKKVGGRMRASNWRQIGVGVDADKRRQKGDALKLAKYFFWTYVRPPSSKVFSQLTSNSRSPIFLYKNVLATFSLQNLNYDHFCNIFVAVDPKIHSPFAKMHRSLAGFRDYCPCPAKQIS